jgi:WD40 repeat protein
LPLIGHTSEVCSVAFSLDGERVVSISVDGKICLWDPHSHQLIGPQIEESNYQNQDVLDVADDTTAIWNSKIVQPITSSGKRKIKLVSSVTFSPDNKRIICISVDGSIQLLDAHNGQPIVSPIESQTGRVESVALSPDGTQFISGGVDGTVHFFDSYSGQPVRRLLLSGHTEWVTSTAFSPDATQIVSSSLDNTIRLWDSRSGNPIGSPFEGHVTDVVSVAFSPDGSRVAASSSHGIIYLWDAVTHYLVVPPIKDTTNGFTSLAFSADSTQLILACIDGTTHIWNAVDGKLIDSPQCSKAAFPLETGDAVLFNMKEGWKCKEESEALLQWLPSNNPNIGLWAYVDGKVVRSNGGGSLTIIDVNDNLQDYKEYLPVS